MVKVEKIMSEMKLMSKLIYAVDRISRKKKNERKYPSKKVELSRIST